jgi:hypothetical protein
MSDDLFDSHEGRLQRVESIVTEASTRMAEIATTQSHLTTKLDEQTAEIVSKMDYGFKGLADSIGLIKTEQKSLKESITPIVELEAKRKVRWDNSKKVFLLVLSATAGVFGTAIGKELLAWLTK